MTIFTIEDQKFSSKLQNEAIHALEHGNVIYLPNIGFDLKPHETEVLIPDRVAPDTKNISYNPNSKSVSGLRNYKLVNPDVYASCMQRYHTTARELFLDLFPTYATALQNGRTSLRPVEIAGRQAPSYRKDDTLLHVDAFPANPNQGRRIIRVFTNVNPNNQPRVWHIGEPFSNVAARFMPEAKHPWPGMSKVLHSIGITKSERSKYDHFMLQIHNNMKADEAYQEEVQKIKFEFSAGATWIVQTDQVSHAVLSGQHVFEQTFYLPVHAMQYPQQSPYAILNKYVKL